LFIKPFKNGGRLVKKIFGLLIIIIAIPALFFISSKIVIQIGYANSFNKNITDSIELTAPNHDVPVVMKDKNGLIFSEEYVEWRNPLLLSDIPLIAKQIFLESEDKEFYQHRGYDVAAIARAFVTNSSSDDFSQGGSTITQQLVRMRFLTTDKTYERKLTELFYAAELEKQFEKNEILEGYMNEMFFGNKVYGIGGAATYYFSRPLKELNEGEIAFIAAIPNNPSLYDPVKNFDKTKKRQERLIDTLFNNEVLLMEQAIEYKETPIVLTIKKKVNYSPTYSTLVLAELEELIGNVEGFTERIEDTKDEDIRNTLRKQLKSRTSAIIATGVTIETAYNSSKQVRNEQEINSLLQPENLQAGSVVIDNETREIVSAYGGKNYEKADFHRAFQAVRQPGSAIKPLLVYAPLFESSNYTASMNVNSGNLCIGSYCPKNYGRYVYGNTSIRTAFRHSHNTAAVRLLQRVGIEEAFAYLEPFKFQSITAQDKNYPAALGGFSRGMSPLELAGAYTSFIDGMYMPAHAIRSVKKRDGNILYAWDNKKIEVWSPSTVATIRDLLKDVVLNGTGVGIPYTTAYTGAKTGTTDQYKDLWVAGLNEHYTTAVWVGYDKPQSMQKLSQNKIHLRIFSAALSN